MTVVTVGDEQIGSAFKREDQMCLGYTSYSAPFRYKIHVLISSMSMKHALRHWLFLATHLDRSSSIHSMCHLSMVIMPWGHSYNWQFTLSGKFPKPAAVHLTFPSLQILNSVLRAAVELSHIPMHAPAVLSEILHEYFVMRVMHTAGIWNKAITCNAVATDIRIISQWVNSHLKMTLKSIREICWNNGYKYQESIKETGTHNWLIHLQKLMCKH